MTVSYASRMSRVRLALRVVPGIHFVRLSAAGPEQRGAQHAGR
jgi:hypothetical protein